MIKVIAGGRPSVFDGDLRFGIDESNGLRIDERETVQPSPGAADVVRFTPFAAFAPGAWESVQYISDE